MELRLEDLASKCGKCQGTGTHSETYSPGGIGSHRVFSSGPCEECGGAGWLLTDSGRALKEFLGILKTHPR